jgi:hypothetical protein
METPDIESMIHFLLKTKKQIQYLSSVSNQICDTKDIEEFMRKYCLHAKTWDSFDIDPDRSITIEFCSKCETIFQK